jgi:hypothetical protein
MDVMPCHCSQPAVTNFSHLSPLCKSCFVDVIERRCRKAAKDAGWLKPSQKVFIDLNDTMQGRALEHIFGRVFKSLPVAPVLAAQAEVIILGKTADDEAEDFLDHVFSGTLLPERKAMNLLANVSAAELEKYCELQGITGLPRQKSELRAHLEAVEKKYPGTMFSLQKSKTFFRNSSG